MNQYRVYLIGGETLILNEEEYTMFLQAVVLDATGDELRLFKVKDRHFVLNRGNITHVLSEPLEASSVVTPQTPTQIRQEREHDEQNMPVTLDEQLVNPEVGA